MTPSSRLRSAAENLASRVRRLLERPRVRLFLKLTLPLLVLAAVALGFHGIPLALVFAKMMSASPLAIAAVLGLSLVQAASGAIRLWFVFPRRSRPGFLRVARAFTYGQFVNTYVPGRAGDAFKVVSIARGHGQAARPRRDAEASGAGASTGSSPAAASGGAASIADTTGALLADRGIDVASLLLLAAVFGGGALVTVLAGMVSGAWMFAAGALAVGAIVLLLRRVWPSAFQALARALRATISAMRAALSAHRLTALVGLALAGWLAELGALVVLSGGLGFHVAFSHAVVALLVLNLGIALPVSVANVGAFEAATAVGLGAFGVPLADGVAVGAVLHLGQIAAVLLTAFGFWVRDRWIARAERAPAALHARLSAAEARPATLLLPAPPSPVDGLVHLLLPPPQPRPHGFVTSAGAIAAGCAGAGSGSCHPGASMTRPASTGPHVPGSYSCTGVTSPSTPSTTLHWASTAS